MTGHGVVVIDLLAALLVLWVLSLVRRGRLWVGYGVMFVGAAVVTGITVSAPGLLSLVTHVVGAFFPTSALTLIALGGMTFLFVYVLSQLTILANRVATLVQELAVRGAAQDLEHHRRQS